MTHEAESSVTLMFLSYLDVIDDLLLNRYTTTKNLSCSRSSLHSSSNNQDESNSDFYRNSNNRLKKLITDNSEIKIIK